MAYQPFDTLVRFDGGANTRDFVDNLPKNASPNPRGVDLVGSTVRKALGYVTVGTEADVSDIGYTLYNHRILSSTELLVKTIGTTVKYLDTVTDTWQKITSATLTAGLRWFFASFNGYMYGGNGTNNLVRWRASAYSTLNGAILAGAATIDLATGTGARFPNAGSGMIEGDTFAWTGKSTDQLTGVTGVTSGHATGSAVIMEMDTTTYTTQPKGSVGLIFANRLFIRDDANPNFYYFSKLADNTTPEDDLANFTIAASGTGDAGFIIFPAPVLGAKEFITGGNSAAHVVYCADGVSYAVTVTDSGSTTVGAFTPFKVLGADLVSKRAIAVTENDMVVIDNFGNFRALGYGDQSTTIKTVRLTDDIDTTVEETDFSNGVLFYLNRSMYGLGRQNAAQSNNFAIVRETNPAGFTFYDHWQLNDLAEANNILYGLSSLTGNVFRLNYGYNADGDAMLARYPVAGLDHDAPLRLKLLHKIRISGYITNNCNLYLKAYADEGTTPISTWLISGSNTAITSALDNVAIGTVVFGSGVVGGGLPPGVERKKFIATLVLNDFQLYYVLNLLFENNQSDVDFALDKMVLYGRVMSADLDREDDQILAAS